MATYASDAFTGSNGSSLSATWTTGFTGSGHTAAIQGNRGRFTVGSSSIISRRVAGVSQADGVITFSYLVSGSTFFNFLVRHTTTALDRATSYQVKLPTPNDGNIGVGEVSGYSGSFSDTAAFSVSAGTQYHVKISMVGAVLQAKVWADGDSEPDWMVTYTDSTLAGAGYWGFYVGSGGSAGAYVEVDDFLWADPVDVLVDHVAGGGLTVGGTAGFEHIIAVVNHYAAGGPRVGGAAGVVVPELVLVHHAGGGLTVGGTAGARVPSILTVWEGAGGLLVGGEAEAVPHTALLAFHGTGGAEAGGAGGLVRSRPRTVHQPGHRYWTFRYELLDGTNTPVTDLEQVVSASVSQNWFADVKRKATFDLVESGQEIDWLTYRIKPWARLHLPPYQDDDWVEWPLGVFLLSSPTRTTDETGRVVRRVQGYDQLQVYLDDKADARYTVAASASYIGAVTTLLGDVDMVVTASTSTLPAAMEWEPGTPKLKIINALLSAVNYQSLSFDEDGRAVVAPYVAPDRRAEEYTYADAVDTSLLLPEVEQELDLFSVANKWVLVVSNPDRSALTATYTNSNPASPTSTVRRGRTIVDYRTEQDAADQSALDAKAERLAFEASQVYESITFRTGLNPLHSGNDVYRIRYTPLAVNSAFSEAEWSMQLKAGEPMQHRARRVVSI